jgi:DNA-binding XRE family transcriptional regulator
VVYAEQGDLFEHRGGYPEEEKEIIAINIFAGQWAHYWLNTVKDGQHYEWTSLATQVLLQLGDNRTEQAAKRFGALLLTMPGATGVFKTTQEDTHAGVLDAIGELLKDEYRGMVEGESQKGQDWGRRMEQLLYGGEDSHGNYQQGMFPLLVALGLLDSFEKPVAELDAGDKGRGWVDRWLALSVRWTSSAAAARMKAAELETAQKAVIEQRVTKPKRPRGTGKTKKALAVAQYFDQTTINAIYAAYRGRNWTQMTFAKELGIARSTLSNVLNRREAPSPELAAKIRAILDSPIA